MLEIRIILQIDGTHRFNFLKDLMRIISGIVNQILLRLVRIPIGIVRWVFKHGSVLAGLLILSMRRKLFQILTFSCLIGFFTDVGILTSLTLGLIACTVYVVLMRKIVITRAKEIQTTLVDTENETAG